jgi:DNA polymerase-3 subunit chi
VTGGGCAPPPRSYPRHYVPGIMTEVRFYHLQRANLDRVLPVMLSRVLERGQRAVVQLGSQERLDALNDWLWSYDAGSFLPHGGPAEGHPAEQPVWLTLEEERPNGGEVLFLADGAESAKTAEFELVAELFDGNDEAAVSAARSRWKTYKDAGHEVTYWQQDDSGRWQQKA